jgi:hypothetical protein
LIKLQRSTSRARLAMIPGSAWSLFPTRIFSRAQHANDFRRLVNDPTYQATFPAMRLDRDTDREITMSGPRGALHWVGAASFERSQISGAPALHSCDLTIRSPESALPA